MDFNRLTDLDSWEELKNLLRTEFSDEVYNTWLSKLNLVSLNKSEVVMSVPTAFIRDWILKDFLNGVKRKVNGKEVWVKKGIKQVFLSKIPTLLSFDIIVDRTKKVETVQQNNVLSISENGNLYSIGVELNKNYTFENYSIGNSNKLAYSVAKSVASGDEKFNSMFIYGSVGLGKTHLLHSMAWEFKKNKPNSQIVYLSAERFMYLFVQALQTQDISVFKEKFRSIDVLLIDDIQFISGKEGTQKEFFHTFNTLMDDNKKVILACDRAPLNLENVDEKLKSRMSGGIVIDVPAPDYDLRYQIAKKKAELNGLACDDGVLRFLAEKINTNGRDIDGAINKLLMHQKFISNEITNATVENILKDLINLSSKVITITKIQEIVSDFFKISVADINSSKRDKKFVLPRQIAMFLSKGYTTKSLPEIGRNFGNKNHATVIHSINKIEELMETDLEITSAIEKITARF